MTTLESTRSTARKWAKWLIAAYALFIFVPVLQACASHTPSLNVDEMLTWSPSSIAYSVGDEHNDGDHPHHAVAPDCHFTDGFNHHDTLDAIATDARSSLDNENAVAPFGVARTLTFGLDIPHELRRFAPQPPTLPVYLITRRLRL